MTPPADARLREAAEALVAQFEQIKRHQENLLVRRQTLESASANWDEATLNQSLDFQPLIDALAESAGSSQTWQPIESAQKDGTRILAWDSYDEETVVFWSTSSKNWLLNVAGSYAEDRDHTFTHWMPLPAPPNSEPPQP